jgi:hypothetical protein
MHFVLDLLLFLAVATIALGLLQIRRRPNKESAS